MNDEIIKSALTQAVAQEIINKLPDGQRHRLLVDALAESLRDYKVKCSISNAVLAVVNDELAELLKTPEAQEKIRAAVQEGFDELMEKIPGAVKASVQEVLFGSKDHDGYSSRCGEIVKRL